MTKTKKLPLIYSCSGCSNIAQLANRIAVELDRNKQAEMSCIAGVGGGVKSLVKKAQAKRDIIAIDGCELACVKHCLKLRGVVPTSHYCLTDYQLKKQYGIDCNDEDYQRIKSIIISDQVVLKGSDPL
ncbi:MAG: zinc-binding protein [Pseudomonadales bacterium]|nr:zinc-binding protein [Pseudomonadales bacterium]MCP5215329.1 zinc-binding protein [Pseudomonadales bacterium]